MGRLFGTDGVRGIAGEDMTCELAMNIGRAAATVLTYGRRRRPRLLGRLVKYLTPARHLVGELRPLVARNAPFTDQEMYSADSGLGAETQRVVKLVVLQQTKQQLDPGKADILPYPRYLARGDGIAAAFEL